MKKETMLKAIAMFCIELIILLPFYVVDALQIYDVSVAPAGASAQISWKTDFNANATVQYGKTLSTENTIENTVFSLNHSFTLSPLEGETNYKYQLISSSSSLSKETFSGSFWTKDTIPPAKVTGLENKSVASVSAILSWDKNKESDIKLYSIYRNDINVANTTADSFTDTGLEGSKAYYYRVSAVDKDYNEGEKSDILAVTTATPDLTAPFISNIEIKELTETRAVIGWSTDENSDSKIYYGNSSSLGSSEALATLVTEHTITLSNLIKDLAYYYILSSCDASSNCANSSRASFIAGADLIPPSIDVDIPSYHNDKYIDIIGSTEPYSTVSLYVDEQLKRKLDSSETGVTGKISFYDVYLGESGSHIIKISAKDMVGNINEALYTIVIDLKAPVLEVNELPYGIFEKKLNITGTVDEAVTLNIYITSEIKDETSPGKVTGLNATAEANSIELSWNEINESDFYQYVIYRDDVGIIATASPSSYNSYTDVLVNSDTKYTYRVAAMDNSRNEGVKSDSLAVKTLTGGRTDIDAPKEVVIAEEGTDLKKSVNATGQFSVEVGEYLDKGDNSYSIKIEAADPAGNKAVVDKSVVMDTTPAEFENIKPGSGTFIYENYADEVDIQGYIEPNIEVKLLINKSGIEKEEFTATSDETGYFEFEDVNLVNYFGGDLEPYEVSATDINDIYFRDEETVSKPIRFSLEAIDSFGRKITESVIYRIGTCWSGNFTWNIIPLTEYQSPTMLSTERIAESAESIYFYVNFSYKGRGRDAVIDSALFSKACDDYIKEDPKYNISCNLMPSSCKVEPLNEGRTTWFIKCDLGTIEGMNKWLEEDWKGFFDSISEELVFPYKATVTYSHKVSEGTAVERQTMCDQVTYVVDNSKINFKDVLPDWLLYNAVNWLDDTIEDLTKLMDKVMDVVRIAGIGCIASFLIKTGFTIYKRFTCQWEGYQDKAEGMLKDKEDKQTTKKATCPLTEQQRNQLTDSELHDACGDCYSAWQQEAWLYDKFRFLCDRVFCHSSPAKWTEKKEDKDIRTAIVKEASSCADKDEAAFGQRLKPYKCSEFPKEHLISGLTKDANNRCYRAIVPIKGGETKDLVFVRSKENEDRANNIYKFVTVSAESSTIGLVNHFYAKDVNSKAASLTREATDSFIGAGAYETARADKCQSVCEDAGYAAYGCGKSQSCVDLGVNAKQTEGGIQPINKAKIEADLNLKKVEGEGTKKLELEDKQYATSRFGYTSDCIFGNRDDRAMEKEPKDSFYGDTTENTFECCCVKEGEDKTEGKKYYTATDVSAASGKPAFEKQVGFPEWSYRYQKIKFEAKAVSNTPNTPPPSGGTTTTTETHNEYNPDRYTEKRDKPACFGFNHGMDILSQKLIGGEPGKASLDPAKDWVAAGQCVCLSGIYNRLGVIKNIMTMMRNCLISVRTTGTADAGVCKDLFSQYVCSLFWQIIVLFRDGCLPFGGKGINLLKSESTIAAGIGTGMDAVWGGVAESQNELAQEYGNTQLNNLLGVGEESIARKVCLAAFGYDWEIDLEDVLDVAYATPFNSLVQPVTKSREYLTFTPDGDSTYEYRASWIIDPGCDLDDYDIYLSCVSRNEKEKYPGSIDCTKQNDPEGVNCDCKNLESEKVVNFYDGKSIAQGVLEDIDYHKIITSPYRYDHLKFELRPGREVSSNLREDCFGEGHFDGSKGVYYFPITDKTLRDITACYVDTLSGSFRCPIGSAFMDSRGSAYFISEKINDVTATNGMTIYAADSLSITPTIWKSTGLPDQCLHITLEDSYGNIETEEWERISMDGNQEYPKILLLGGNELKTSSRGFSPEITPSNLANSIDASFASGESIKEGYTIQLKFKDISNNGYIDIGPGSKDTLSVNDGKEKFIGEGEEPDYGYFKDQTKLVVRESGVALEIRKVDLKAGEKEITFTITARERKTNKESDVKKLRLELVHLKEGLKVYTSSSNCNGIDHVKYKGKIEGYTEREYKLNVKAKSPEDEARCSGGSSVRHEEECICGDKGEKNCGGKRFSGQYCYANKGGTEESCHQSPLCEQSGIKLTDIFKWNEKGMCDCDGDGKTEGTAATPPTDCNTIYPYCFEGKCSDKPQEGPDTTKPSIINFKVNNFVDDIEIKVGEKLTISSSIEDKESGIGKVFLFIDNKKDDSKTKDGNKAKTFDYTETWTPAKGSYTFNVKAENGAGIESDFSKEIKVTVK